MQESSVPVALNEKQTEAVMHTHGPCLVLAGAGTGKTRVLVHRAVRLVQSGIALPENLLLVTFTNKAANQMKERIVNFLGYGAHNIWVGTFHSVCVRILRQHADKIGLSNKFSIIDSEEQFKLIKQVMQLQPSTTKDTTKSLLYAINRLKDRGITADDIPITEPEHVKFAYPLYQNALKTLNALDFNDLILTCIQLFRDCPEVLDAYQQKFQFIMVDEYQDTNIAQYVWVKLLAQAHSGLYCVGDDDQSIYAWRGAEVANILRFDQDFPKAKIIKLEQNYRSTHHIISVASALIAHNKNRLGKDLFTSLKSGEKVHVQGTWDSDDEARLLCDQIHKIHKHHSATPLSQFAILVRASFQTRDFEERLMKIGLPYYVLGGARFYERQEIRDAIAYLRMLAQPDDGLAFERILNIPRRGIGLTSIRRIHEMAGAENISFTKAAFQYAYSEGHQNSKVSLKRFFDQIAKWRNKLVTDGHAEIAEFILEESGYLQMWRNDKSPDAQGRVENLREFFKAIKEFESLQEFLDHISLVIESVQSDPKQGVQILTLHASKGLEFDYVFLPGWEEGLFPHQKSLTEHGERGAEEERRLAYVAISRAKKGLWITYTMQRRYYHSWQTNVPSRFIKEIPKANVCHLNPNGIEIHKPPVADFIIGERVFHEQYGYGDIIDLDAYGLYIKFDYTGLKKIAQKFVEKSIPK